MPSEQEDKKENDWLPYILINCCCNQVNLQRQRMLFIDGNGERPLGTAGGSTRSFFFEIFDSTHAAWRLKSVASGEIKLLSLGFPTSRVGACSSFHHLYGEKTHFSFGRSNEGETKVDWQNEMIKNSFQGFINWFHLRLATLSTNGKRPPRSNVSFSKCIPSFDYWHNSITQRRTLTRRTAGASQEFINGLRQLFDLFTQLFLT